LWSTSFGSITDDAPCSPGLVVSEQTGQLFISGAISGVTNFGPGVGILGTPGVDVTFILCLNSSTGRFLWARGYLYEESSQPNVALTALPNGAIFAAATYDNMVNVGNGNIFSNGGDDIIVWCMDTNGILLWSHGFGGSSIDQSAAAVSTSDGLIIFTGFVFGPSVYFGGDVLPAIDATTFLVVFDSDGNHVWSNTYPQVFPPVVLAGNQAKSMALNRASNLLLMGGEFFAPSDFGGSTLMFPFALEASGLFMAKFQVSEMAAPVGTTVSSNETNPSSSSCPLGTLKCPCKDGLCDTGLECGDVSNVCVVPLMISSAPASTHASSFLLLLLVSSVLVSFLLLS